MLGNELAWIITLCIPIVILWIHHKLPRNKHTGWKCFSFLICLGAIIYFTMVGRSPNSYQRHNFLPLWSYSKFYDLEFRWGIYLNIMLFIPFGFILAWAFQLTLPQLLTIGFLLTSGIETIQYFLQIGFCEIDDVINNTLGTGLGYAYWRLLEWIEYRYGTEILRVIQTLEAIIFHITRRTLNTIYLRIRGKHE